MEDQMIVNKAELDKMITTVKSLETRTEAAEAKVKTLEEEKAALLSTKGYNANGGSNGGGSSINSDEQRALRAFGCSSVKQLLEANIADKKFERVDAHLKHVALNAKEAFDKARFIAQMFHGDPLDVVGAQPEKDRPGHCKAITETYYGKQVLVPMLKAFGTTVAGEGAEWVPTGVATSYLEEYELKKVLEGRFKLINMPTNPFDQPKLVNGTKARIATEGQTNFAGASFGTDKIRFTATKLEEFYPLPEELSEDSAPDFLGAARDEVVKAQERGAESAIINGDADGTHQDSDTQAGAANLAEKAWDGLRKLALANSANGSTLDVTNAAISKTALSTLLSRMGKFGSNPDELLIVAGPVIYNQLRHLDDVFTVEKFGPMAVVLKGALMAWAGIPIINSEHFREDLNASGVYDGTTTTRAGLIIVNTTRFMVGQRRPIKVKLMPDLPGSDRWLLASYRRVTFKGHAQGAVEKSVVYGYNIAK
jgi:HK97 family phage major capsid protein